MFTWNAHEGAVTALAFGPDGRFLVSAGTDECVRVWDPLSGSERACIVLKHSLTIPSDRPTPLSGIVVSPDGERAVVHRERSGLAFLDLTSNRLFGAVDRASLSSPRLGPDGESIFGLASLGTSGRYLVQFLLDDGDEPEAPPLVASRSARALAFAPDGSRIAAGRQFWNWPRFGQALGSSIYSKDYEPDDLAFSADNRHLFALVGGKVVVYGLPDGLFKTKLKGHNGRITAMALTPDGARLWTASHDATVKGWDTHSLTLDRTYTFQTGALACLAVSPDGNVAAVGSGQKGTITLWDLG